MNQTRNTCPAGRTVNRRLLKTVWRFPGRLSAHLGQVPAAPAQVPGPRRGTACAPTDQSRTRMADKPRVVSTPWVTCPVDGLAS